MEGPDNQFVKKYQRRSQTPWEDDSKILWLADYRQDEDKIELSFDNYVYVHRDAVGKILGISISKSMLEQHQEFENRYLEGIEMTAFLLLYVDEIADFCGLYSTEFEELFLLPPEDFFTLARRWWLEKLENFQ